MAWSFTKGDSNRLANPTDQISRARREIKRNIENTHTIMDHFVFDGLADFDLLEKQSDTFVNVAFAQLASSVKRIGIFKDQLSSLGQGERTFTWSKLHDSNDAMILDSAATGILLPVGTFLFMPCWHLPIRSNTQNTIINTSYRRYEDDVEVENFSYYSQTTDYSFSSIIGATGFYAHTDMIGQQHTQLVTYTQPTTLKFSLSNSSVSAAGPLTFNFITTIHCHMIIVQL